MSLILFSSRGLHAMCSYSRLRFRYIFLFIFIMLFFSPFRLFSAFFLPAPHIKSNTDLENVFIEGKFPPYIIKTQERRKKIEKHFYSREELSKKANEDGKTEGKFSFSYEPRRRFSSNVLTR